MPELPEVETVRRSLAARTAGVRIKALVAYFPGCIQILTPEQLSERLFERRIVHWGRMGKYLIAELDDGARLSIHLRMTGQFRVVEKESDTVGRHTRLVLLLEDGRSLQFDDQRKFGRIAWYPDKDALVTAMALGPEPTSDAFGPGELASLMAGRTRPVKSLLLDQRIIAGVGNIYADEALYRAGLHPARPAGSIERAEIESLWQALRDVLTEGIIHRGTSLRDYIDTDGRKGDFQERLRVYGREGKPCFSCGDPLARVKVGGRSSFHCRICQS